MPVLKRKVNGVWVDVSGISSHAHNISDILDFPTSIPADGGNADTLGGKSADEFAAATDIEELRELIENIPATEQVQADWNQTEETAPDYIKNKPEVVTKEYIDEAVSNVSIEVDATLSQEGKAADAKAVGDAIAAIEYVTATDDGNGIVTLNISSLQLASKEIF